MSTRNPYQLTGRSVPFLLLGGMAAIGLVRAEYVQPMATPGGSASSTPEAVLSRSGGVSQTASAAALDAAPPGSFPRPLYLDGPREFYFTRGIYTSDSRWGSYGFGYRDGSRDSYPGGSWRVDYPKADRQFVFGLRRMTILDAYESENPIYLTDQNLSRYPFLYMLEVGNMTLTEQEVESLRRYLQVGGFLFIDDFWGSWEWMAFDREISRVLPGAMIVDLPLEHPLFHSFYDIEKIEQVPSIRIVNGGPTYEQDGFIPRVRAIFDADDRLMVLINWNTDLGDAWEWVDNPYYPLQYSNFAYQLAVNAILYAMSH